MRFSDIIGQERAKAFLTQVMAREKIPHAYLFTGIPGIGKASTARALTAALNCMNPEADDSCGVCATCRKIRTENFPDFVKLAPEGQFIKIDQIRELNRALSFAPNEGGYRVCFVERSESLTDEAANSFLKTLEEPPPGNILILSATEPLDLLPTIVSRCQRVPFRPLTPEEIEQYLMEREEVERDSAVVLARVCRGSLGEALRMKDSGFLEARQEWLHELMALVKVPQEKALPYALQLAEGLKPLGAQGGDRARGGLQDLLETWANWYRDLLVLKTGGPESIIVNVDFSQKLKKSAKSFKIGNLIHSVQIITQAGQDLSRNRNPGLVLEHVILALRRLCEWRGDPDRILERNH
ncbi:MAG: DNA polymerase III subunit delta' [Deltaproteobacteria bacterium]|nr:DNA polymerase III subunit delta' [Deltaproteobacteria bacterium]MBW1948143.1 DNA polymerase III subunit delta' [Deltaproteobacteria bacterium]